MLKLIRPTTELEKQYNEYMEEWEQAGEKIVPYASRRNGFTYSQLLGYWKEQSTDKAREDGFVPASLYFLVNEENRIYGAVHIRHELNEYLLNYGGHIGYGVRPSERRKGYATKMLSMALPMAKELGIKRALITCDKKNKASAKTIKNNGGILENEVVEYAEVTQRYWVDIK